MNSDWAGVESTEAITSARDASDTAVAFGVMFVSVSHSYINPSDRYRELFHDYVYYRVYNSTLLFN